MTYVDRNDLKNHNLSENDGEVKKCSDLTADASPDTVVLLEILYLHISVLKSVLF